MKEPGALRRIVMVDDDRVDRMAVRRLLDDRYLITEATTGSEGLEACKTVKPVCVLLDFQLPDLSGLEFLEQLQCISGPLPIPVVMLTGQGDELVAVQAMKAGAQDYLVKGRFDSNDLTRAIQNAIDKVEMARSIEVQRQELERLAVTDELTGLHNRRWFVQRLDEEVQRALRYNTPLCLMLIDVDRFKGINDTHGHLIGDLVLRHFAAILRRRFRETDFAARLGGDEFVGLLAGTALEGAIEVAERLQRELHEDEVPVEADVTLQVTCSIGIAELDAATPSAIALLQGADSALYQSKERGRNCISAHHPSSE